MHLIPRFWKDQSGTAIVEFAIVLPLFLVMVFGTMAWGFTLTLNDAMYDAARQAARELSVRQSDEETAEASALAILASWPFDFDVTATDVTEASEDVTVVVTVENGWADIFEFVPLPSDLSATVVMRKELP